MQLQPCSQLAKWTISPTPSRWHRNRSIPAPPPKSCKPWYGSPIPSGSLVPRCLFFQTLNLSEVIRAMSSHPFYIFRDCDVVFEFGMVCRFLEVLRFQPAQELQGVMPVQSIDRDQLRCGSLQVAEILRPGILIHGSNHWFLVSEHLPEAMRVHDFDVRQVTQHLQDAPLVR